MDFSSFKILKMTVKEDYTETDFPFVFPGNSKMLKWISYKFQRMIH